VSDILAGKTKATVTATSVAAGPLAVWADARGDTSMLAHGVPTVERCRVQ
jgi:hypothetical protein